MRLRKLHWIGALAVLLCAALGLTTQTQADPTTLPLDQWQRHIIDDSRPGRAVFVDAADLTGDGLPDIVAGGSWYQNPGSPGGTWARTTIGGNLNNMAVVYDLNGDGHVDILGTTGEYVGSQFIWAENDGSGSFTFHTNLPSGDGDFLQGARAAQIIPGGNVEVVLSWHNATSTQMLRIPTPASDPWTWEVLSQTTNGEQIAIGDLDRDTDLDIHLGTEWLQNPWVQNGSAEWTTIAAFTMGDPQAEPDRVELADIDQDGLRDVIVAAEGSERLVWAKAPSTPLSAWVEQVISTDILAMSLDVGDVDGDGDVDVVVGEHNTSDPDVGRVVLYQNMDGGSSWNTIQVDSGLEHHDGTQFVDIDTDGDLDIVSIGWTHNQVVLYENRAIIPDLGPLDWVHLNSKEDAELPSPDLGTQQTSALILDVDRDGVNDLVVGSRRYGPSLAWYRRGGSGWTRYVIEGKLVNIEAGGTSLDIDGDQDLDIVMGADSSSNEVWWWENPWPDYEQSTPWTRRLIKDSGETKHHDQIAGDFDGDGSVELVFWNQGAKKLFLAEIPANPRSTEPWPYQEIFSWSSGECEGLAKADINLDGKVDLVGCGRWFEHTGGTSFTAHAVDSSQAFTRAAAGQLKMGGWPEVVFVAGDATGRLQWYEWTGSTWQGHDLLGFDVDHGHSLAVADINGDGVQDLFCAEMRLNGGNEDAKSWVFLGDGSGNFATTEVSTGFGNHESRVGDLDGDGDLDILGKPYNWDTPRLDVWLNSGSQPATCYTLSLSHTGAGADPVATPANSSGCPTGQYIAGQAISLTASPDPGWSVAGWSGTSNDGSTAAANTLTMPASNHTVSVVYQTGASAAVDAAVSQSSDDAEEKLSSGSVSLGSTDLELVYDGTDQMVGLRFQNLDIPHGATITNAFIQFTTDEKGSTTTNLIFRAQAADNPPTFSSAGKDISSRPTSTASVPWNNVPAWNTVGQSHQSPDLSPIVQQIVNRPGWSAGHAIAFLISGSGKRTAESFNGEPAFAPQLHIEYQTGAVACYTLSLSHTGAGASPVAAPANSSGCPAGQYTAGQAIDLTASPDPGWSVAGWSGTANDSSTATANSLTMPGADHTVSVTYQEEAPTCYTLSLSHSGAGADPVATPANSTGCPSGQYTQGQAIDLTASPDPGWSVAGWSGTANDGSTATANTLTMPASNHTVSVAYQTGASAAVDAVVSQSSDDAEETLSSGQVTYYGWDLELGVDREPQIVGLRFQNLDIPHGATISQAAITFYVDKTHSSAANLTFHGQASDNAPTFSNATSNLSSRPKTTASVPWNNVAPWTTVHAAHPSPDLSAIIQQIVNRPGWSAGHAIAFLISGSGTRTAVSYDGDPAFAPQLHIEYQTGAVACYTLSLSHTGAGANPVAAPANSTGCPAGQYIAGQAINLTASPDLGWHVSAWSGTSNDSSTAATNSLTMPGASHTATVLYLEETNTEVYATAETAAVPTSGDSADDPAIWIHPTDPSLSTVIGTDKWSGLAVYDLSGNELQYISGVLANNVDLRYNFPLNGETFAVVGVSDFVTTDLNATYSKLRFYVVDPSSRLLQEVTARAIHTSMDEAAYGFCMYHSPISGSYYAFVTSMGNQIQQWELFDDGTGQVDAALVRTLQVGSRTEGCVADDVHAQLYVGEEDVGIWKYGAEPGDPATPTLLDHTGAGGHLTADVEGLSIYYASDGTGYLLASSQGADEFIVYEREGTNTYVMTFIIVAGDGIDAVISTDGIDVTNAPLGDAFPGGLFVAQDHANYPENQNFKLVPWELIAQSITPTLTIDLTWNPRSVGAQGQILGQQGRLRPH